MDFLDDPDEMTPEERLAEVAAILAAGYRRLRQSSVQLAPAPDPPPFTEEPLDCSGGPLPLCFPSVLPAALGQVDPQDQLEFLEGLLPRPCSPDPNAHEHLRQRRVDAGGGVSFLDDTGDGRSGHRASYPGRFESFGGNQAFTSS